MGDPQKLLTLKEASEILHVNPEVLRRWLRGGRVNGVKVGSDWRISQTELSNMLRPARFASAPVVDGPKMCIKSPKWLEYSGLPKQLNDEIGPEAWPLLKKLVEIDFEKEDDEDRRIPLDTEDLSERTGYSNQIVERTLEQLADRQLLSISKQRGGSRHIEILTPLRTPRMILDIPFKKGGVQDAPSNALKNRCMRRYLEAPAGSRRSKK
ncbi:MAG TPA: helix-turn-helix domain-containing protein [Candidatus Ozemobacteraceae bacterium]|nr:helix-turn-helix domain-containing protein [Candidatus Ozemobacteraceae bacterium]HQG29315.1 helix-turn-helix domain-containing protein [Candidatus Ozemobacteraceae bacterium]